MNLNFGKGSSGSSSNSFNFDLGIGSNRSVPLKDQKNPTSYSSAAPVKPSWQPNKPSWTHQPAPSQPARPGVNGPVSMVGDIHGKSWNSGTGMGSGIGIVEKNPNLFGDLVGSALGKGNKGSSNVPLKNAAPTGSSSGFSMGNVADSLPKSGITGANWGSGGSFGVSSGGYNQKSSNVNVNGNAGIGSNKSSNLGGPSIKGMTGGSGGGVGLGGNKDPFGSLVDLASKKSSGNLNSGSKNGKTNAADNVFGNKSTNVGDDTFGNFQNAAKPSTASYSSGGFGASSNDFMGSNTGFSSSVDDFGGFASSQKQQPPVQTTSDDPLNMFFSSSSGNTATASAGGAGEQQFSELDDWGMESDFSGAGNDSGGGGTTELEGLPPPPAGISASAAKNKGVDSKNQGQYADAIKWLSWAVILHEKSGDSSKTMEVLSCRASCYKEVGEYKKAVADCTKVLEFDDKNTSALVQRALLYESMEKYKLGAEDLRSVLKIDPSNRIARSTVHRLTKMAG
ncbi:Tetratricopeptide repeat (TPR)-like superfamily protein [Euphorbia peplus]|nr:Tetratricopeptide repeat (TPR)-like superfamily protein [Euphorbia peplus]